MKVQELFENVTDAEREAVYDILTVSGPDVNMHSIKFTRLVGRAVKAGVLGDKAKLKAWLKDQGMFDKKSDDLRGDADILLTPVKRQIQAIKTWRCFYHVTCSFNKKWILHSDDWA